MFATEDGSDEIPFCLTSGDVHGGIYDGAPGREYFGDRYFHGSWVEGLLI